MSEQVEGEAEHRVPGCGLALLALTGAGVPIAACITVVMEFGSAYPYVLLVTLFVVAALGGSAFAIIRERPTWQNIVIAGFVTGAFFPALLALSALTEPADYFTLVGGFGIAGVVGAMIAWLLVKWLLTGGLWAKVGVGLLIAGGLAAMWIVPWAVMDRTCHNTMRDGRTSISPVAEFRLHATMRDWPAVQGEIDRFARENGWDVRADVRPDPGFPWFQVSVCREPGTYLFVTTAAFEKDQMSISVYQPQGGDSWQAPFRKLQEGFERRWPGGVGYDYSQFAVPRPPWAPPTPEPSSAPLRPGENSL